MPSFDLAQSHTGLEPDLILGAQDHMDCIPVYGISNAGKDFIAFLQEYDDPMPIGHWSCLIPRRDFDAYAFDGAINRGLVVCQYCIDGPNLILGVVSRT
jgi:hypothetical protein